MAKSKKRARANSVNTKAMKRRKQNRNNRIMISVMVLIMAAILSGQMLKLKAKDAEYNERMEQLEKQLADEQQITVQLEQQDAYVNSDKFVEDTAKAKLGMIHKDEIVFKEK